MIVYRPVRTNRLTQKFAENNACAKVTWNGSPVRPFKIKSKVNGVCPVGYKPFYPMIGLKGHNGQDNGTYHGEPCYFPVLIEGMTWTAKTEVDRDGGIGVDVISDKPIALGDLTAHIKFRFWHLKRVNVYDGQKIRLGQLIGYCDSTGASSGDHLHWAMKRCDAEGNTYNTANGYSGAVDFSDWYVNQFVLDTMGQTRDDLIAYIKHQLATLTAQLSKLQ